jgi:hypothetical protein
MDSRICQTFTATPAEPGGLLRGASFNGTAAGHGLEGLPCRNCGWLHRPGGANELERYSRQIKNSRNEPRKLLKTKGRTTGNHDSNVDRALERVRMVA